MATKNGGPEGDAAASEAVKEAAAAALEAVKKKAADPVAMADDLIHNTKDVEIVKGNQRPSGGWLHSPANLEMFALASERLMRVAEARGIADGKINKVRASYSKSKKTVYIYPTDDDDIDGIPVVKTKYGAWVNLISLLGPIKYTLQPGQRARYELRIAREGESPVGPALVLNLNRPLEKRWAKESEGEQEGSGKGAAAAKEAAAKPAPAPAAEAEAAAPEAAAPAETKE